MSDVPAGWYDDPENPAGWRYWDGATWTEHRSPKGMPAKPGAAGPDAPWQIVSDMFGLVGRHWREFTVVVLPVVVLLMLGIGALYAGFDQTLNIGVGDFLDRVSQPGFDPANDPADEQWWDSVDFSLSTAAVGWWAAAAALFLASLVGSLALTRFAVGAAHGRPPTPLAAWTGAAPRMLRLLGWGLLYAVAWTAALVVVVALAVVVPLTLIVTVPAIIAAGVWTIPYVAIASTTIVAGPRGVGPVSTARELVRDRWWKLAGRMALIWIVVFAVGIPLSAINGPLVAASLVGALLFSTIVQAVQNVIGQSGAAVLYRWAGGPVDPALTV